MAQLRILFVGAIDFSRHCLEEVLDIGGDVVGVITLTPEKAGYHSDYVDLSVLAYKKGLQVVRVDDINSTENYNRVRALHPDVIFVCGWSQLISKRILDIPPLGCIGTHPALLPKNRGRHPLIWALVEGLKQSGLTFFFLDDGVDSGDILWQKSFDILLHDDVTSLYEKIKQLASEGIRKIVPMLQNGTVQGIPQDHSLATYWRRRHQQDGVIDWSAAAMTIYNLIRALTHPYVGAHTYVGDQTVRVWQADLPDTEVTNEAQDMAFGTVFAVEQGRLKVRVADGYLTISAYETSDGGKIAVQTILGEAI